MIAAAAVTLGCGDTLAAGVETLLSAAAAAAATAAAVAVAVTATYVALRHQNQRTYFKIEAGVSARS
jgi:hypothetical protein